MFSCIETDSKFGNSIVSGVTPIGRSIDALVDDTIPAMRLYTYSYLTHGTGFEYNTLSYCTSLSMPFAPFKLIPRGSFTMGSPPGEIGCAHDEEVVFVTISKPFEIMVKEVTQLQWFLLMGNNPSKYSRPSDCNDYIFHKKEGLCPNNPIENVSKREIQSFIKKLNSLLGLTNCNGTPKDPKGCYRLPTEADWCCSRGGRKRLFPLEAVL